MVYNIVGCDFMAKYEIGNLVTGVVTGIEKYGVFVRLDDYYSGLIHISEISSGFVKNVNDYVAMGETIKAKIIDVDDKKCHLKLSIKDIPYKYMVPKASKIVELGSGFNILASHLDEWIKIKMKEYDSSKEK